MDASVRAVSGHLSAHSDCKLFIMLFEMTVLRNDDAVKEKWNNGYIYTVYTVNEVPFGTVMWLGIGNKCVKFCFEISTGC